ncbi:MAG TPA: RagB/SusD family nutrient uptake outer membrane protein, partial [Puia sp.]
QNGPGEIPLTWKVLYAGVNASNVAVKGIKGSPVADGVKAPFLGEARLLRAWYYFLLTNYFGDVPLWTEEQTDVNATGLLPKTPAAKVYEQVISDLVYAEGVLPDSYSGNLKSRATKGAAQALLARVYLYKKDWQKADDEAKKVIQSGKYKLLPAYGDVFLEKNERNDEIIFTVEFKTLVVGTWRHSFYTPQTAIEGIPEFTGYGTMIPTVYFKSLVADNDLRKPQLLMSQWNGKTLTRTYFGPKFLDIGAPVRESGKDFIVSRYAEMLLIVAEAENEISGPTAEAYARINEVRSRAGLAALSGLSQDGFRMALMKERAVELVGEAHQRWDLLRWGKFVDAIRNIAPSDNPYAPGYMQPYYILFPIPAAELLKNPNLTQNPGYGK